jgi:hypothetical protein
MNIEFLKDLQNQIDKLECRLKVTEEDRDLSKYVMGILVANCMTILEKK